MRNRKWLIALTALMASGLIAAGCGDDDEDTTAAETTTAAEETTSEDTTSEDTTSEDTTTEASDDSGGTPDDVYAACIEVFEGTPGESAADAACEQARNAFEQCLTQAESVPEEGRELAIQACQDAVDQTIQQLESTSG